TTYTVARTGVASGTRTGEVATDANVTATSTSRTFTTAADNEDATGNTAAVDTAYMPATAAIRGETMVALPGRSKPDSQLVLTADQDATVTITPVDSDGELGEASTQELAADTAVTVEEADRSEE